jgi:hypothetical protein
MAHHEERSAEWFAMAVKLDELWNGYPSVFAEHLESLSFAFQKVFLVSEESDIVRWGTFEYETAAICKSSEVDLAEIALNDFHLLDCDF